MHSGPLVLAHRGACLVAPENTIAAFERAITMGADGVELDVHRTSDGELVVHHDAELEGYGLVLNQPFAALRAARPDVPTLAEVFDVCTPLHMINVEMKCCSWDADPDPERVVARGVAALIAQRQAYDKVAVSSFDLEMIDDLRSIDPRVTTGWLIHGIDPVRAVSIAKDHGHAWLHPDWGNLAARLGPALDAAREHGVAIDTWTVDDPEVMRTFAAAGVDAIITNAPDVAVAALRS